MQRLLKMTLSVVYIFAVLVVLAWTAGWLTTWGNYFVPPTVQNDDSLPFFEINGYPFHGESLGNPNNPVIIVLNGGPGNDYRMLLPLADLQDRYFIVFYDQRGCGLSKRVPDEQLTMNQFVKDLDDIVGLFAQERGVILIGHSFGAMLAAAYINVHGDKVDGAVLAEPGFLNSKMAAEFMKRTNWMRPKKILYKDVKAIVTLWFKSLHIQQIDGHERADWLLSKIMTLDSPQNPIAGYFCGKRAVNGFLPSWRFGASASLTMIRSFMTGTKSIKFNFADGVDRFENEVLFIASACNTIIGEDIQKEQIKMFKKADLLVIPDAGHSMIGEQRERVLAAIRHYLLTVEHR